MSKDTTYDQKINYTLITNPKGSCWSKKKIIGWRQNYWSKWFVT